MSDRDRLAAEVARRAAAEERERAAREQVLDLIASRERVVGAADEERRRLRDHLHDGAQQQLVSITQALEVARRMLGDDDPAREWVERARDLGAGLRQELADLARGLHPVGLERGLGPALARLARNAGLAVELAPVPERRLPVAVELTVYFVVSEALTNAAKHAQASAVTVTITQPRDGVTVRVADDGRGGADVSAARGLLGLRDRVESMGGTLAVDSPPGVGTTIEATLPASTHRSPRAPFFQVPRGDSETIDLIVTGRKRAGVGLLREFDTEGGPPRIGQRIPVLDADGRHRATLRIVRTLSAPFGDLTERDVQARDLGVPSFEGWRTSARRAWHAMEPEFRVLFDDPAWRFTDAEPVVVHWSELDAGTGLSR